MKFLVFIAFVAIWRSTAIEGYGYHHNHPHHGGRFPHSPHGFHGHGSHGYHHSYPSNHNGHHEDFRQPPKLNSFESSDYSDESDSGSSFESSEEESWHEPHRHNCKGWRCHPQTTRKPCHKKTTTPKPTRTTRPSKTDHPRSTSTRHTTMPDTGDWDSTKDSHTQNWHTTITPLAPFFTAWFVTDSSTDLPIEGSINTATPSGTTIKTWNPNTSTSTSVPTQFDATTTTSTLETDSQAVTISDSILECLTTCPSTQEYNPVCGTDGTTFDNIGKLFCAKSCGIDVELWRTSICPPPPPPPSGFGEERVASPITVLLTTTIASRTVRATDLTDFQNCMKQCPITSEYKPICGTDRTTYVNLDRMNCARDCGRDVQVLCDTSCGTCYAARLTTASTTTTTASPVTTVRTMQTTATSVNRFTQPSPLDQCSETCPVTEESNPVCGSDGVTYANPSQLLCAQLCGQDVRVAQFAACPSATTERATTIKEDEVVTLSPTITNCLRGCPVTSEYNPVCGTDWTTYDNPGRLECAKSCGINVALRASRPCFLVVPDLDEATESSNRRTKKNDDNRPVVTPGPSAKFTSAPSTATTTPLSSSLPTSSNMQITSSTTNQPSSTTTISPDIINAIFNMDTTKPVGDDYDLDPRFGEQTTTAKE